MEATSSTLSRPVALKRYRALLVAAMVAFCVASLSVRWRLASELPFVVDELADLQLAVDVSKGALLFVDRPWERAPGMTYLLATFVNSDGGSVQTANSARRVMWFASTLVGLGVFWIVTRSFGPRWGLAGLAFLLTYSSFLERGLRIRADLFATLLSLVALAGVMAPRLSRAWMFLSGLALGAAFVVTQKAVYFVAAFAVAVIARLTWQHRGVALRSILCAGGVAAGGFLVVPAMVAVSYWWLGELGALVEQTLLYGAYVGLKADVYSGTSSFVAQTIQRNLGLWLLAALGCWYLVRSLARRRSDLVPARSSEVALLAWAATLGACYAQHTTKFPYIFINIAPTLALLALFGVQQTLAMASAPVEARARRLTGLALLLLACFMMLRTSVVFHARPFESPGLRRWQEETMNRVDALTTRDDAVLDGVGMAVTRRKATTHSMTARWFAETADGAQDAALVRQIEASEPPVALWNYRIQRLSRRLDSPIEAQFVGYWGNILVAGVSLEHSGGDGSSVHEIRLPASIRYGFQAAPEMRVEVDGIPLGPGGRVIRAGSHSVEIWGPAGRIMIAHAAALEDPVEFTEPRPLYPSYSN